MEAMGSESYRTYRPTYLDIALKDRYSRDDDEHGGFGLPWHEPRTFRIRVSPNAADYVRERIWATNQQIEDCEDGGLILTLATRSEPELRAWVRSFGDAAVLLEDDTPREQD